MEKKQVKTRQITRANILFILIMTLLLMITGFVLGNRIGSTQKTYAADAVTATFDLSDLTWSDGTDVSRDENAPDIHKCWFNGAYLFVTDGANIAVTGTARMDEYGNNTPIRVVIRSGAAAVTLTSVRITATGIDQSPILLDSGANLALTLIGNNTLVAGSNRAALQAGANTSLTIGGSGSLTATGGARGAGIGGGYNNSSGSITINGGTITATAGSGAAAIGQGSGGTSGAVNVIGNFRYKTNTAAVDPGGDGSTGHFSNSSTYKYVWLKHIATIFSLSTKTWDSGEFAGTSAEDLDTGNCWIEEDTFFHVTDGADIILTGISTADGTSGGPVRIIISGTVSVTLDNVNITATGADQTPILLESGANLTLKLTGESGLIAGSGNAGLQVGADTSLTIVGDGSLTSIGGAGAAGIGGGAGEDSGSITINRSRITAIAGEGGLAAAIGRSDSGEGGTVTVTGVFNYKTSLDNADPGGEPVKGSFINSFDYKYVSLERASGMFDLSTKTWDTGESVGTSADDLDEYNCWLQNGTYLWVLDGADIIVTGTSTTNGTNGGPVRIVVKGNASITLSNANITAKDIYQTPVLLEANTNLTLKLVGDNVITAGTARAALQVPPGTAVTIGGDGSLTATGGNYSAGIGGSGNEYSNATNTGEGCGTITINGGNIRATGGLYCAGIGGAYFGGYYSGASSGTIIINAGNITAIAGSIGASAIGYSTGMRSGAVVKVVGKYLYKTNTYSTEPFSEYKCGTFTNSVDNRYVRLEYAGDTFDLSGKIWESGKAIGTSADDLDTNKCWMQDDVLYITDGAKVTVTSNGINTGVRIVVSGTVNLVFENANISAGENQSPLLLMPGSEIILSLYQNNIMNAGNGCAGIQISEDASLTVGGSGSLIATGGNNGAGIGGGNGEASGSVTIKGGTVTANGGYNGAGIGGGNGSNSGSFVMNGDCVVSASSVSDTSRLLKGVLFLGDTGTFYGEMTLISDFTVPADSTLLGGSGAVLTIPKGITLTNNGTISLQSRDAIAIAGTFSGNRIIIPMEQKTINATYEESMKLYNIIDYNITWNDPYTDVYAGDGQQFGAVYNSPDGYFTASGNITVNIAKAPQFLDFHSFTRTLHYENNVIQLFPSYDLGPGAITYALISGRGTVTADGLVSITGGGEILIRATKAGNKNYEEVTFEITITVLVAPEISDGEASMTLTEGYNAISTEAFTISGDDPLTVTIAYGNNKITWNNSEKTLDIAAGLLPGTYIAIIKARNKTSYEALFPFMLTVKPAASGVPVISTTTLPGGNVGTAYSQTLAATGDETIIWSIESGSLPNGLTLLASGTITGIISKAGTFNFDVRATNGAGHDIQSLSIVVTDGNPVPVPPAITTSSLAGGNVGTAYSQTLAATGDATIIWTITAGSLPDGLTLLSNGTIAGKPGKTGTFNFTIQATNGTGSDAKVLFIVIGKGTGAAISAVPTHESKTATSITVNTVTAPGNGQSLEYAISTETNIPTNGWQSGVTFTGLSAETGYYIFARAKANDDYYTGAAVISAVIKTDPSTPSAPMISTNSLPGGEVGVSYSQNLAASGANLVWSIESGALPNGLTLLSNGTVTGAPLTAGTYHFTVKVTNAEGSDSKALSITVTDNAPAPVEPTVTTESLPGGTIGTAYNAALTATGDATIIWSIESGALPDGLTLLSNGAVTGTPSKAGTYIFIVRAANNAGHVTKELSIVITDETVAPAITGGQDSLTLTEGYTATSTDAFTVGGSSDVDVSIFNGNDSGKFSWNSAAKKLDIAAGLTAGTYTITLKATNGTHPDAYFTFTLTVNAATVTPPTPHVGENGNVWVGDVDTGIKADSCTSGGDDNKGLSAGAAAGIAIAVTAVILLGGFSVYWFIIRKRTIQELFGKKK